MGEIESLMNNIHPSVATMVRKSLLTTLVNMIDDHRKTKEEIEQIESEIGNENFGIW